jgi:flavin reductase (DIM6/NTAB) family NADH-FMN oxidoreductase RutF
VAWLVCSVRSTTAWDALVRDGAEQPAASHVLVVGEVVDAGERERLGAPGDDDAVLSMDDTRMNYGG